MGTGISAPKRSGTCSAASSAPMARCAWSRASRRESLAALASMRRRVSSSGAISPAFTMRRWCRWRARIAPQALPQCPPSLVRRRKRRAHSISPRPAACRASNFAPAVSPGLRLRDRTAVLIQDREFDCKAERPFVFRLDRVRIRNSSFTSGYLPRHLQAHLRFRGRVIGECGEDTRHGARVRACGRWSRAQEAGHGSRSSQSAWR